MNTASRSFPKLPLTLVLVLVALLAACGGGSDNPASGPGPITAVELIPNFLSLERGQVGQVAATARDANGAVVLSETITFASSNPNIQVANNGLVCAGQWDSLTNPVVCNPASLPNPIPAAGVTSQVTASAGGVTSNPIDVLVHAHVDNIVVTPATVDCKSQDETQQFAATAFSGGVDITASVGPFFWSSGNSTIVGVNSDGLATARAPGRTTIVATVGGTSSLGASFTTCGPEQIRISHFDNDTTSFSLAVTQTQRLGVAVTDVNGKFIGTSVRWNSSNTSVVAVSETGTTSALNPGQAIITASCTPPVCNLGVNEPVYSNPVTITVTGTGNATRRVYVGGTDSTSLIPINRDDNTAGNAITLPHKPNSMMWDPGATRLYMGSDTALMILNPSDNSVEQVGVAGRVLAISPDSQRVVITRADVTFILRLGVGFEALPFGNAARAAFSADSYKAFILEGQRLHVWSENLSLKTLDYGTALGDVDFDTTGAIGMVTSANLGARATCRNDTTASFDTTVAVGSASSLIGAVPGGGAIVTTGSGIAEVGLVVSQGSCPPVTGVVGTVTRDFGLGAYTPRELHVSANGARAWVVSNLGALLTYDVTSDTASPLALGGGGTEAHSGGFSIDSRFFYVGVTGAQNEVQVYDAGTGALTAEISVSFVPNLVAVRPI